MENPGLKKHEPFLKVVSRRTAAPMAVPTTQGIGGNVVPPEPPTLRQNVQTPPPLAGTVSPPAVSSTNGAEPILRLNDANETANQRRITQQQQVGGGAKENPAYEQAQRNVRDKVLERRAHPLHQAQGTWDTNPAAQRGEIVQRGGSESNNLVHFIDPLYRPNPNDMYGQHADQPMIDFKAQYDSNAPDNVLDPGWHKPDQPTCETCYLQDGHEESFDGHAHDFKFDHDFKPLKMEPGQRYSNQHQAAQVPSDDPVFPYNPQENPEHDTVDPENLQSGDDTFRPQNPDVDRVMNHLQGLPDMSRNDPRLMDQVNSVLDEAPDTEEGNRGADALAMGLNTIFDSSRETEGLPREERLQRGKDAIDAHFEASQLSHKEHVKQLHDDWLARGGHKTGEPRPVERFSPKYTKPQQIVPDPSNPFPELESPILYAGKCDGCGKKLYDSADSSGDPRGALGDHTLGTIDAAEYDATDSHPDDPRGERRMHGPSALICPSCDNEEEPHRRIEDKYRGHKAGDRTGGGYWGHPPGSDTRDWNARKFISTTYSKDRKGKWHNPGEKPGSCFECDNGITGFHRRTEPGPMQSQAAWSNFLREAHNNFDSNMADLLGVQGTDGNWDYDPYMHGLYNGMALGAAIHDGPDTEPEYREAPDTWREDKAEANRHKTSALVQHRVDADNNLRFFHDTDIRPTRDDDDYAVNFTDQPMINFKPAVPSMLDGMDIGYPQTQSRPGCETCWLQNNPNNVEPPSEVAHPHNSDHPFKPFSRPLGERFSAAPDESDEDFWARQPDVVHGDLNSDLRFGLGDAYSQEHVDPEDVGPHSGWQDDSDEVIPDNMSLRDHMKLVNSGTMQWDGTTRHPRYTRNLNRQIVDSDGNRAFADEHHAIEYNSNHHGPVLPTTDNPEPHVLQYPWSHTYYPAGQSDDEGLTRGYNTPDQALQASQQLSLWGARHPKSQEILNSGYRYVGNEMPYDPERALPHELAPGVRSRQREAAYDDERQQFLYNIHSNDPDYYLMDKPPSAWGAASRQQMADVKEGPYEREHETAPGEDANGYATGRLSLDDGNAHHPDYPGCLGCAIRGLSPKPSNHEVHDMEYNYDPVMGHEYEPVEDLAPGVRL